jgi:hypothetical protein
MQLLPSQTFQRKTWVKQRTYSHVSTIILEELYLACKCLKFSGYGQEALCTRHFSFPATYDQVEVSFLQK